MARLRRPPGPVSRADLTAGQALQGVPALDRGGIWGLHDTGQQVAVTRQAGDQARLARTLPLGMPQRVQVLPEQVERNLTGPVIIDEVVFA